MDQFSAHLDRGWDLAQKGDASGASACARRALELDPQSPEVHNLLGYTAALVGDSDEALEHYRQAIALDETYLEAMLNAAELLMHPLGEWDEAIDLCSDALDYAETKEEMADCLLLRVDALVGKGDIEEAKKCMSRLPEPPFETPSYLFLIGRAFYELGEAEKALPYLEEAIRAEPYHADAHYYLGLLRDDTGNAHGAVEAFLRARSLDLAQPLPAWASAPDAFAQIVRRVVRGLDALLSRWVRNAEVYIFDVPGAELVVDGIDPRAMVIVDARPPDNADNVNNIGGETPAPQNGLEVRLFIYQRNVERSAGAIAGLESELTAALEREITAVFIDHHEPASGTDKQHLN
ncbi:MAG: tetratricopeptide repeat protein [Polyangiaceae bacterium]|nr:tetratricopeptide repeat protein [Polyangiaceae bacterium]